MSTRESNIRVAVYVRKFSEKETLLFPERSQEEICAKVIGANDNWNLIQMIIPGLFEPPVRTLRATIPENESHIFR